MIEIAAAVLVVAIMAGLFVFMLRGARGLQGSPGGRKGLSSRILFRIAGDRRGPEFVSGLLAVLGLAAITASTGAELSNAAAGAGLALLAFVCRLTPIRPMVKAPVHALYSVLGLLAALAAAKDYLFPPASGSNLEIAERWALLALVWFFTTFGTFVGFAAGKFEWKVGLLLFAWTEVVIYMTAALEVTRLDGLLVFAAILIAAFVFGVLGTMFRDLVEITAAVVMALGSMVLMAGEQGIMRTDNLLQLTGPTISMIVTFVVLSALLRILHNGWHKFPLAGRKA